MRWRGLQFKLWDRSGNVILPPQTENIWNHKCLARAVSRVSTFPPALCPATGSKLCWVALFPVWNIQAVLCSYISLFFHIQALFLSLSLCHVKQLWSRVFGSMWANSSAPKRDIQCLPSQLVTNRHFVMPPSVFIQADRDRLASLANAQNLASLSFSLGKIKITHLVWGN